MQLPTAEPCSLTPAELDASPVIKTRLALILLASDLTFNQRD